MRVRSAILARLAPASLTFALVSGASRAEETKGGMPQLDPHSYSSQVFWLALFFLSVFLFLRFVGLPRVTSLIEERSRKIDGDLSAAELLRGQASEAEKAYEATMASAHGEARQMLAATHERNMATLAEQTRAAAAESDRTVADAVGRIEADRAVALRGIREVAKGLAAEITFKLAGRTPSADSVARAIDSVAGQEAA
jgi:F-type H+-transporting ATPase subunit b